VRGHLHEEITRFHRCQTLEELLNLVFAWLQEGARFAVEDSVYVLPLPEHGSRYHAKRSSPPLTFQSVDGRLYPGHWLPRSPSQRANPRDEAADRACRRQSGGDWISRQTPTAAKV
jgi:hypothetical protein